MEANRYVQLSLATRERKEEKYKGFTTEEYEREAIKYIVMAGIGFAVMVYCFALCIKYVLT